LQNLAQKTQYLEVGILPWISPEGLTAWFVFNCFYPEKIGVQMLVANAQL